LKVLWRKPEKEVAPLQLGKTRLGCYGDKVDECPYSFIKNMLEIVGALERQAMVFHGPRKVHLRVLRSGGANKFKAGLWPPVAPTGFSFPLLTHLQ